ncbi:biliverdin-producing heme oxygenase [Actinomadura madurae]|nr:biliverdin-producing heme oxygenase [Actinomadura madurae]MCP9977044.1 biliverdin-producing heme oxygenase [Actinomadura madurae]
MLRLAGRVRRAPLHPLPGRPVRRSVHRGPGAQDPGAVGGDDGVRFYRFPGKPKAYKERYRALLDAAPWDAAEQDRVIAEVKAAYRLNAAVTAELGEHLRLDAA